VFGALLGLGAAPKFKTKKFTTDEFEQFIGVIEASVRCVGTLCPSRMAIDACTSCSYDTLRLTSDINVRWSLDEGTFKFSGSYGK
jgi:hypothetical protein